MDNAFWIRVTSSYFFSPFPKHSKVKEVIQARLLLTPAYMLAGSPAHTVTAGAIRMRDLAVADAKVCAA